MTLMHASCAAREEGGVLLLGPPGSGKSDLLLRLLDVGFDMVGDDRIEVDEGWARPSDRLAGLLEIRGLGIVRLPYRAEARLALAVELGQPERLPSPATHAPTGLPMVVVDPFTPSAARRVALAFECVVGRATMLTGAFAA
jgi:HPr kinase/phosphorylase